MRARDTESQDEDPAAENQIIDTLYERVIDLKTGVEYIKPVVRSMTPGGEIQSISLAPVFGAKIASAPPRQAAAPSGYSGGHSCGDGFALAGHLEKRVDPDTGDVWFEPVVYVVEAAKASPNALRLQM